MLAAALSAVFFASSVAGSPASAANEPAPTAAKRELTQGQIAARDRQKKCGAEWKEAKAKGKTEGLTWPKFWSKCNARLKAKTQ